jgi:hypothetical protein
VGHGISIGYPVLETFESESTSDCWDKEEKISKKK